MIHHDVESLFWVAMYAVFRCASREESENTPEEVTTVCKGSLEQLRSSNLAALFFAKRAILAFGQEIRLPGRWFSIRNFLSKVAALCATKLEVAITNDLSGTNPDPQNHDIGAIVSEADAVDEDSSAGLDEPAPRGQTPQLPVSGSLSAPQPPGLAERTTSTSNRIKRSRNNDDASYQGRRGGVPGPRERSKRIRTGANSQG
ncbi:hypothetical protein M407DRAFT_244329 [Tulasnella calospora MUT 4182]|uniref:Uncharacterized protein n=1 Tax=Tulasnella calospora MUT 4182 TaxID=1051891 RepID=A0A0C3Q6A3_9AGAM|nr:hypothetical protein M407DRAFT_244329 [Tulasnella calospora MUT 4182]